MSPKEKQTEVKYMAVPQCYLIAELTANGLTLRSEKMFDIRVVML